MSRKKKRSNNFHILERIVGTGFFIDGGLYILIPLFLLSIGVKVEEIGIILALSPLMFGLSRIIFSIIADVEGVKPTLLVYSFNHFAKSLSYLFFPTTLGVALGKIIDGVGRGAIWATLRTAAYKFGKRGKESAKKVISISFIGLSLGNLASLILSSFIGVINSFFIFFALSIVNLFDSSLIRERTRELKINKIKKEIKELFRVREEEFYLSSFLIGIGYGIMFLMLNFILAFIYREYLGLSLIEIGINMGIIYLISGVMLLFRRKVDDILQEKKVKRLSLISKGVSHLLNLSSFAAFLLASFLLTLNSKGFVYLSSILFGISFGKILRFSEDIIYKESINHKKDISLEIALLTLPSQILQAILTSSSGFLISYLGVGNFLYLLAGLLFIYKTIGTHTILHK